MWVGCVLCIVVVVLFGLVSFEYVVELLCLLLGFVGNRCLFVWVFTKCVDWFVLNIVECVFKVYIRSCFVF